MAGIPTPHLQMFPIGRGNVVDMAAFAIGVCRLATDPIGSTTVTFDGVPAGSEIRVSLSDQTEVAGIESCAADQVLNWSVYASGNPNNVVRIVIVNMVYKIKDFLYTSKTGVVSIPIQMDRDPWFSNPA